MTTTADKPNSVPWDTSVGNRFAHYSPEDHSAPLWIAAALSLIYVLGMLLVRTYLKWKVFGWDDILIILSTAVSSVQSVLMFKALNAGLGKSPARITNIALAGRLVFSSRILLVLSLYLAKLSVLFLLRRISVQEQKVMALLCNTVIGLTICAGLASVLVISVGCPTTSFFAKHCHNQVGRWTAVTAIDVIIESLAFFLPIHMVWRLQMKVRTKLRVIAAFGFRLIALALYVVHLSTWVSYTKSAPSTFSIVPTLVLQQVLLCTSLVAATIPNLKAFLRSLSASWGGAQFGYATKAYGNRTYEMHNVGSMAPTASQSGTRATFSNRIPSGFRAHKTTSGQPAGARSSLGSGDSQDLIIRKESVFTVERS